MAREKKTPVWLYVGCGCLLLVVLVVAGLGTAGWWGANQFKTMVEDMADPLARDEATMRLLGADKLPDGWHSHVFFRIPVLMKVVMLTDGEAPEAIEGGFEEKVGALENLQLHGDDIARNVFVYFDLKGRGDEPLEDIVAGRPSSSGVGQTRMDLQLEIERGEALNEGVLELGVQTLEWRAQTGSLDVVGDTLDGIYLVATIRCPQTDEPADALWFQRFGPAAGSATAVGEGAVDGAEAYDPATPDLGTEPTTGAGDGIEIEGTPADPAQVAWLFSHFDLCQG